MHCGQGQQNFDPLFEGHNLEKWFRGLQNIGFNSDKFKLLGLREKHALATWNLRTITSFSWRQREDWRNNLVPTSQETHYIITKTSLLILFGEIIAVCPEDFMKLTNILQGFYTLKRMYYIKYAIFHLLRILERQDCHCYGFTSLRINGIKLQCDVAWTHMTNSWEAPLWIADAGGCCCSPSQ
jgi:hypothetical protein